MANHLWAGRAIAARERGAWRCGASMWVLMIVLASCQDVAEQPAQIEPVKFDPAYPSLHTVPARPQLSYTVEQRRAIVDMLIADRSQRPLHRGSRALPRGAEQRAAACGAGVGRGVAQLGGAGPPMARTRPRLRTRHAPCPPSFPRPNSRPRTTVSIRSCGTWSAAVPGRNVRPIPLQPVGLMRMPGRWNRRSGRRRHRADRADGRVPAPIAGRGSGDAARSCEPAPAPSGAAARID